jgi:hypothetical protein
LPQRCDPLDPKPSATCGGPADGCLHVNALDFAQCGFGDFVPAAPDEYCCERACLSDPGCTDASALRADGLFWGEVTGRYDATDAPALRLGFVTRTAAPQFDPLTEGQLERSKPDAERARWRIIGVLRHDARARPAWHVVATESGDVARMAVAGGCP